MPDIDQLLADSHEHSLLIRVSDVARITTLSQRLIWQKIEKDDDTFPKPMRCGRLQLWSRREVVEWVARGLDARVRG